MLHQKLEEEILTPKEIVLRNEKKLSRNDCEEVSLYLEYLLIFRYSRKNKENKNNITYYDKKKIIFNILKFLNFTKAVTIQNNLG